MANENSGQNTSVFNMDQVTVTEKHSPSAMSKVPGIRQGVGQPAQIATEDFLLGCPGVDAKLVRGQRWQTITGDRQDEVHGNWDARIFGNRLLMVGLNEEHTIIGNATRSVYGNICSLVLGAFTGAQVGPYIINFVAPMVENHASTKSVNEPFEVKIEGGEFALKGWEVGIVPGVAVEVTSISVGVVGIKGEAEVLSNSSAALSTRMHIGAAKIVALDTKLGALLAKAQPAVNAAPGGTIISPVS